MKEGGEAPYTRVNINAARDSRARDSCSTRLGYLTHSFFPPLRPLLTLTNPQGASLMIFANKQDLAGALTSEEIASALDLNGEKFKTRHWSIMGCSAVTGEGLLEGMDWVVDDISSRIFMLS